jgi:hypothetical protein
MAMAQERGTPSSTLPFQARFPRGKAYVLVYRQQYLDGGFNLVEVEESAFRAVTEHQSMVTEIGIPGLLKWHN